MKKETKIRAVRESVSLPEDLLKFAAEKIQKSVYLNGLSDYVQRLIRMDREKNLLKSLF